MGQSQSRWTTNFSSPFFLCGKMKMIKGNSCTDNLSLLAFCGLYNYTYNANVKKHTAMCGSVYFC